MANVELNNVCVDIPVYNSRERSLKKRILNLSTGGKIGIDHAGHTVIRTLDHITLSVKTNERIGILGHNGAGKTSLLRLLGRVYTPTSGRAKINGSIGSLIGISLGIDPEATGYENIYLRGVLLGLKKREIDEQIEDIVEFSELGEFINMPVRTYSSGMHMRLAFSVSTMVRPDILLMDEWLSVGDEAFKKKAQRRLTDLINNSNILFLASHSRSLIENSCTRAIWLEKGAIKADGNPIEICREYFK